MHNMTTADTHIELRHIEHLTALLQAQIGTWRRNLTPYAREHYVKTVEGAGFRAACNYLYSFISTEAAPIPYRRCVKCTIAITPQGDKSDE